MSVLRQPRCTVGGGDRSGAHPWWRWTSRAAANTGPGASGRAHRRVQQRTGPSSPTGRCRRQSRPLDAVPASSRAALRAPRSARANVGRHRHLVLGARIPVAPDRSVCCCRRSCRDTCCHADRSAAASRRWLGARFLPRTGLALAGAREPVTVQPCVPASFDGDSERALPRRRASGLDDSMDVQHGPQWSRRAGRGLQAGVAGGRRGASSAEPLSPRPRRPATSAVTVAN